MDEEIQALREALEKAEANLKAWMDRWDNYSGNNPGKYQTDIKAARREVNSLKARLAAQALRK
jgi:hypothetical protein